MTTSAPGRSLTGRPLTGRPLGPLERWFWLANTEHPTHFVLGASIGGTRTAPDIQRAVDQVRHRHPLLRMAVREVDGRHHFQEDAGAGIALTIQPEDGRLGGDALRQAMHRAAATPFAPHPAAPQSDPLARITVLLGADAFDVVLSMHHAIGDGISARHLLHDLLVALTGGQLAPYDLPPDLAAQRDRRLGPPPQTPLPPSRNWPTPFRDKASTDRHLAAQQLPVPLTGALLALCRARGITLHALVAAALALTRARILDHRQGPPVRIFSPTNLRPLLGIGDALMVATGVAVVALPVTADDDALTLADRVKEQLQPQTQAPHVLAAGARTVSLMRDVRTGAELIDRCEATFGFDILLTNIGPWPFAERIGDLSLRHLWGPVVSVGFRGEQTVGLSTVGGCLHLMHSAFEPIPGLLAQTVDMLTGLVADTPT